MLFDTLIIVVLEAGLSSLMLLYIFSPYNESVTIFFISKLCLSSLSNLSESSVALFFSVANLFLSNARDLHRVKAT